jgi:uncharacterized protein YoxC
MNEDTRPAPSLLVPFAILAISFAVLLIYQIVNVNKQHSTMQETKTQLAQAITQRDALVKQSGEVQAKFQAMLTDLLQLAQTNEKAKAIVQKYNIALNPNAAPTAAAPATP